MRASAVVLRRAQCHTSELDFVGRCNPVATSNAAARHPVAGTSHVCATHVTSLLRQTCRPSKPSSRCCSRCCRGRGETPGTPPRARMPHNNMRKALCGAITAVQTAPGTSFTIRPQTTTRTQMQLLPTTHAKRAEPSCPGIAARQLEPPRCHGHLQGRAFGTPGAAAQEVWGLMAHGSATGAGEQLEECTECCPNRCWQPLPQPAWPQLPCPSRS